MAGGHASRPARTHDCLAGERRHSRQSFRRSASRRHSMGPHVGAQRVELYTEPFARAFERGPKAAAESYEQYLAAAECAHQLGLGVNAGHDLDLQNLTIFRSLPHLDEVSIGHALISRSLFVGLRQAVRDYLQALTPEST